MIVMMMIAMTLTDKDDRQLIDVVLEKITELHKQYVLIQGVT